MSADVLNSTPLGPPPWPTLDPFLFCVHHRDDYPAGNGSFGPAASLQGRQLGMDFEGRDGWRMYHGNPVPGFPQHPHRGFETITIVRRGYIDHSDSLGAAARFGAGDVQWLTAGGGIVHSEMFPLLRDDAPNPLELFQIWLNLPAKRKLAPPYFSMFWSNQVPRLTSADGRAVVTVVAGNLGGAQPPAPPPDSWAAAPESDLAVATIELQPGGSFVLPRAQNPRTRRCLYVFSGSSVRVGDGFQRGRQLLELNAGRDLELASSDSAVDCLLLQGRPLGEPVAHYGPFVMNTQAELRQAMVDYQRTQFGGWPWPSDGPVHGARAERFARYPDGRVVTAPSGEEG